MEDTAHFEDFGHISVAVVDDNRDFLEVMRAILGACGIEAPFEAEGAREALEHLRDEKVDIILTDQVMPEVDGIELIRRIRADHDLASRGAHIICISGYAEADLVEAAVRAGADDFIAKPVSPNSLVQKVKRHIEKPLEYFETESYFGPDRRRILSCTYHGPERRRQVVQRDETEERRAG